MLNVLLSMSKHRLAINHSFRLSFAVLLYGNHQKFLEQVGCISLSVVNQILQTMYYPYSAPNHLTTLFHRKTDCNSETMWTLGRRLLYKFYALVSGLGIFLLGFFRSGVLFEPNSGAAPHNRIQSFLSSIRFSILNIIRYINSAIKTTKIEVNTPAPIKFISAHSSFVIGNIFKRIAVSQAIHTVIKPKGVVIPFAYLPQSVGDDANDKIIYSPKLIKYPS